MGIQRWTPPGSEIDLAENGDFVLFTDHEQVVAEMTKLADGLSNALEDASLELVRLRAELAAKSKEVQELHSGIAKALDEIEDAGPKALKYAEQELRTAMGEGNGR